MQINKHRRRKKKGEGIDAVCTDASPRMTAQKKCGVRGNITRDKRAKNKKKSLHKKNKEINLKSKLT